MVTHSISGLLDHLTKQHWPQLGVDVQANVSVTLVVPKSRDSSSDRPPYISWTPDCILVQVVSVREAVSGEGQTSH